MHVQGRVGGMVMAAWVLCSCGSAGTGESPGEGDLATGSTKEGVQLAYVDITNQFGATAATNMLTTGSSTVHGAVISPATATVPGAMCGSTFISKHYAITAAHCVDGTTTGGNPTAFQYEPSGGFTVQQIDTSAIQPIKVLAAAGLSGTSNPNGPPSWTRNYTLTAADGYAVTSLSCKLTYRCDATYGPRTCPFYSGNSKDIALVHCAGRTQTGYVTVNTGNPSSGNVSVVWFHEILNLMTSSTDTTHAVPANNYVNYGQDLVNANDFHYSAQSTNQLLPLVFMNWPGGAPFTINNPSTDANWTDIPSCHGTSGSGTFINGTSTLLGPVIAGTAPDARLCFDMPNAVHGNHNTLYDNPVLTRAIEASSIIQSDR